VYKFSALYILSFKSRPCDMTTVANGMMVTCDTADAETLIVVTFRIRA